MAAPPKNKNAQTHGLYPFLGMGSLPRGASYIRRQLGGMERALQNAVRESHGEMSIYMAALIMSACRHEGRSMLLARWLRKEMEQEKPMPLSDRLAVLKEIGSASDSRDKCIEKLGLHVKAHDPWAELDAVVIDPPPQNVPALDSVAHNANGTASEVRP